VISLFLVLQLVVYAGMQVPVGWRWTASAPGG
jgi:hypothetical protein